MLRPYFLLNLISIQRMKVKGSKRKKLRKVLKSTGQKVRNFAKARVVRRFLPLFGLIAIVTPSGPVHALTIDTHGMEGLGSFGKNGTFFVIAYEGMRQVTSHGVAAIPHQSVRSAVSTTGSIAAMVAGIGCGAGTAFCGAMGWEQKAIVCAQGVGVCAGIAKGMHEGDPSNPIAVAGGLAASAAAGSTGSA